MKLGIFLTLCLLAGTQALPTSLLEDLKEAKLLQTPARSNKVKRAQEVLMFGNQQNRGTDFPGQYVRTDKRASDLDNNKLTEGAIPMPFIPQVEVPGYDTNSIDYPVRVLPYVRNPFKPMQQAISEDPVLSYGDIPIYNYMNSRRKRGAHKKMAIRAKRDSGYSRMEEILRKMEEYPRTSQNLYNYDWRVDDIRPDYYPIAYERQDLPNYQERMMSEDEWNDFPVWPTQSTRASDFFLPRQDKRFMVSKRDMEGYQFMDDGRNPLYSRFDQ